MHTIIPGISSLIQYNEQLQTNTEAFRPDHCPTCGKAGLWVHGSYDRKADYEHPVSESLNPVTILRFYCPCCKHTCSILPECIPPRRHYPWSIQQVVLLLLLKGLSYQAASQQTKPSRWTISRWWRRLQSQFLLYGYHLRSCLPSLGRISELIAFWKTLLDKFSLSHTMLILHNAGVVIP